MAVIKILTEKQESLLRTCRNVLERCSQNATEMAKVPRFAELVPEMAQLIADIDAAMLAKQASRDTTKVTEQKNQYVADLIATLDELSKLADTIGLEKNNEIWRNNAEKGFRKKTKDVTEETLIMIGREFAIFLRTIGEANLAHYGITADDITEIETIAQNIIDWRVKKEVAVDQKTIDNTLVVALFDKLEMTKSNMDTISTRFIKLSPDFYTIYDKARIISAKSGVKSGRTKKDSTAENVNKLMSQKKSSIAKSKTADIQKNKVADKGNAVSNGEVKPSDAGNDTAKVGNA